MATKPKKLEREFGIRVSEKRRKVGLTQEQLAKKMKFSRATLANIEAGHQRTMLWHALRLRELIGVKI